MSASAHQFVRIHHPSSANLEALAPKRKTLKLQFLIGERDAGWMCPAQRVHDQLQALGLDSRLEVIQGTGQAIKEIIGRAF